ncbi:MAG: hypothetical protein CSB48_07215 [Proteobacteria bacterium]|nr:MAG: hypothetical protein CSB48_07215 [Pseudomonadota bacterium]PIE40167.1 MAG: hypothetical protein CSA51_02030 [Gammaproteobacteria bacterium]
MLGEDHSLTHDFPEYKSTIARLIDSDETFASECKRYNAIDEEIRELELNSAPIDDTEMHQLKHQRAELKDMLYQKLVAAK